MKKNSITICKILMPICFVIIIGQFVLLFVQSYNIENINARIGRFNTAKATITYRQCEHQCIGYQLGDTFPLISLGEKQYKAKDVFGGKKTMVYFFSRLQCKSCIESQIEAIKAVFENDSTNIVLLANSTNYRELYVFKHTNNLKCPIYRINEPLNLPADIMQVPYFLLIDENLKVVNAFITMKERMDYSLKYLKSMYRYFNSDKDETNNSDITIDKKQIDLGNIKNSSSKTVRFTITNNSEQNIQFDVIPDCDCTTIDFGNGTLQAQEKKQITATIKFDEKGDFVKYIYVYHNNNHSPIEVEIRGCVN